MKQRKAKAQESLARSEASLLKVEREEVRIWEEWFAFPPMV